MKLLLLLSLYPFIVIAQPSVCWVSTGATGTNASCPCDSSQTPCIKAYIGNINTTLTANMNTISSIPQPVISNGLELVGASANWINHDTQGCWNTNTCVYTNLTYEENFVNNILQASGARYIDWNFDYFPYIQSTEYQTATGFNCSSTYSADTCARLTANLSFYDSMFKYISAKGLKIRLAPISFATSGGGPWLVCGLTPSTMTVAQMDACLAPFLDAIITHSANLSPSVSITDITALHEPTEAYALAIGQTLSVANWATAVGVLCTSIHSTSSTVNCGSGYSFTDGSYVTNVTSSVPSNMTFLGIDFYYEAYDSTPTWINQGLTYKLWCQDANTAGIACKLNESGAWPHCPNGVGGSCVAQEYEGCGWIGLQTYNVNNAWASFIPKFASAIGASYVTLFGTQPFAAFQSAPIANTACSDNSLTSYTATMLQTLQSSAGQLIVPTLTGYGWLGGNFWGNIDINGNVGISGRVSIF